MSLIKRDHFTTPTLQSITWNPAEGVFTTKLRVKSGSFEAVAVQQPFALDFWQARHGYELWDGKEDSRERKLLLVALSDKMPEQPEKGWKALYTVPVWSNELLGQRELVIKGEAPTGAFADLFDLIETKVKNLDEYVVPVVSVSSADSDYGQAPVFEIIDWRPRPDSWGKPIVNFAR